VIAWEWLVVALLTGIGIGWAVKSASLISRVVISEVEGPDGRLDHYVVRFGERIVGRSHHLRWARRRRQQIIATIRGRRMP
jgi:hypothetical protein